MEADKLLEILKAISDESRFKIISMLLNQDLCVGGLARKLDISKPAVSQHLQLLRKVGLVTGEKRGYYTHYSVNAELLKQVAEDINKISLQSREKKKRCNSHETQACKWRNKME